jgi:uncharacterized protein (TIGR03382 family)
MRKLNTIKGLAVVLAFGISQAASPTRAMALEITGIDPTSGVVGDSVTITGSGFTGAQILIFNPDENPTNGEIPKDFTDTQMIVKVPAYASTGPIRVCVNKTCATSAEDFTVLLPSTLAVSGINPESGAVGDSVTITGTGFIGVTSVVFNPENPALSEIPASYTATQMIVIVPAYASTGKIQVCVDKTCATSAEDFIVIASDADAGALDAAEPDAGALDAAEPDAAEPDAAEPDAAEPDAAGPDAAGPDAAGPDAAGPDAALSPIDAGVPPGEDEDTSGCGCGTNGAAPFGAIALAFVLLARRRFVTSP